MDGRTIIEISLPNLELLKLLKTSINISDMASTFVSKLDHEGI